MPKQPKPATSVFSYGYKRIVLLLIWLVIVPSVLLTSVGITLVVLGDARINLLSGILVISFTSTVITGVVLVWVFVRRDAKLSELQADFVSKVSHELRTPLTSIRMYAETLAIRRGNPDLEARSLEALTKESKRLQDLIDRLLDWGRMESGRRVFQKEPSDVAEVVGEAVAAFEPLRERQGVELGVEIADGLPSVTCDRGAIKDALINLLSNAYKYGGETPVIRLRVEASDGKVRLSVSDNGMGIDRGEHKRIFEKFYRVDDRLSRAREGSGLGLAIVQHVMRAHRGHVEVDSAPGRGSTFTLVLPADGDRR